MKSNNINLTIGIFLIGMFMISLAIAGQMPPVKQGETAILRQTCGSCSYVNISVYYPNSTKAIDNQAMTNAGGGYWEYNFSDTEELGKYDYPTCGDISGVHTCSDSESLPYIEVTPSGSLMKDGDSLVLFGSLLVMIILSSVFLYIASHTENLPGRVTLYCVSFIGYMMAVLYAVVTIQQILFGFDSIITGIETFLFVGKIGVSIGFIALMIIIFLIMLKAWKIKRGFDD